MNGEQRDRPAAEVVLPGGASVQVRLADDAAVGGFGSVGLGDKLDLDEALAQIGEVAALVRHKLVPLAPTKAKVEFGVSFTVQSGKLTALVFDGKGTASLTVSLEWQHDTTGATPAAI